LSTSKPLAVTELVKRLVMVAVLALIYAPIELLK
jgi:hypothetical protein